MDRRAFLVTTTAAAATTAVAADGAAAREQKVNGPAVIRGLQQLTYSSPWTADVPVFGDMAADLKNRLQTALGDRYSIIQQADQATESDLVFSPAEAIAPSVEGLAFFSGLPGTLGLLPYAHQAWLIAGGGQMLWDDLSSPHGWKPLLAGHTGSSPGLWTNRALHSVEDLANTTITVSGIGGRVADNLSATVVELSPGELVPALGSNRISASEWGNPLAALMLGLPTAATHYYHEGISRTGTALALNVRLRVWNDLGASDRAIIEGVTAAAFSLSVAQFSAHRHFAIEAAKRSHPSLIVAHLPASLSQAVDDAARKAVMDMSSASADAARIRHSYEAFSALFAHSEAQAAAIS